MQPTGKNVWRMQYRLGGRDARKERKKDKPHLVPLSRQAMAMFEELKGLASKSPWVLPSRNTLNEPIAHSTLNQAIRSLDLGVRDFVIGRFGKAFQAA